MIKFRVLKNRFSGILSVVGIPPVPIPIPEEIQLLMYEYHIILTPSLIIKNFHFNVYFSRFCLEFFKNAKNIYHKNLTKRLKDIYYLIHLSLKKKKF